MRIHVATWRDVDHDDAGGSEVYLDHVTRAWATLGHEVTLRAVATPGEAPVVRRHEHGDGAVTATRRGGRLTGVPRVAAASATRRDGSFDLAVDLWNGLPFASPLWARRRIVVLHHLHADLWPATFGRAVGGLGQRLERSVLPWLYRSSTVATLSSETKAELVEHTVLRSDRIHVIEPGVSGEFVPAERLSGPPTMVIAARMAPLKRVAVAVGFFGEIARRVPGARLVVIGDGEEADSARRVAVDAGVADQVRFEGRVDQPTLVRHFQQSDLLLSASVNEGWGMTVTEAAACGTPAVVSPCAGHRAAVGPGAGIVAADDDFVDAATRLLTDRAAWSRASAAAIQHSSGRSWDGVAARLLALAGRELGGGST